MKQHVFVAASQPLAACGLEAMLAGADDFQVVGTIRDLSQLEPAVAETPANILVVDLDAPPHPPDLLMRLKDRQPELKIIAVGAADLASVRSLFELGVDGYHLHPASPEKLVAGLRQVVLAMQFGVVDSSAA